MPSSAVAVLGIQLAIGIDFSGEPFEKASLRCLALLASIFW